MGNFYPRGVAIPDLSFVLIHKMSGAPVTSVAPTIYITKDGGAQALATNTATHNGNGEWLIDLTAAERDADKTSLTIIHTDAVPVHIEIKTDAELGAGALSCTMQLGGLGAYANVWVTSQSNNTVIASGVADGTGNITFYLNAGSYYVYRAKNGVNFSNPAAVVVTISATFNLQSLTTAAAASLETNVYADIAFAESYFSGVVNSDAWDAATTTKKNKALLEATRAIDLLDYQGDPTQTAIDNSNQFPRGDDLVVPSEIKWACCEEALALLSKNFEDEFSALRIASERFSGAQVTYQDEYMPEHTRSGILSRKAWNYLRLFLKDNRVIVIDRV